MYHHPERSQNHEVHHERDLAVVVEMTVEETAEEEIVMAAVEEIVAVAETDVAAAEIALVETAVAVAEEIVAVEAVEVEADHVADRHDVKGDATTVDAMTGDATMDAMTDDRMTAITNFAAGRKMRLMTVGSFREDQKTRHPREVNQAIPNPGTADHGQEKTGQERAAHETTDQERADPKKIVSGTIEHAAAQRKNAPEKANHALKKIETSDDETTDAMTEIGNHGNDSTQMQRINYYS